MKNIIDVCCGSRMFYDDKENPDVVFMDNRELQTTLCDGRELIVSPDIIGDFRAIPFDSESFSLVIFDPPHLLNVGDKSWMCKKYGKLNKQTWAEDLKKGFNECIRVLKPEGTLIFKWASKDIKFSEILKVFGARPLISHKNNNTYFAVFWKRG